MDTSLKGKVIVNFGDSIFGNFRPPEDISTYLSEITGATVYNAGYGGCRMGVHPAHQFDRFCMYRIADAVTSGDFSPQEEAFTLIPRGEALPKYFRPSLDGLEKIDFSQVDIATIAYGTNDFTGGQKMEGEDRYDVHSFAGALRYSIEKLQGAYPAMKIVLCGQLYRFWFDEVGNPADDSDTRIIDGHRLLDFCQKTEEIALDYGLLYLDCYHNSGIEKETRHICFTNRDGTHPAEEGRRRISAYLARELYAHYGA